ncbi:hypothetical protein EXIGLDRAFT_830096 [Exidia glandulosa HHB12029]|uniref:F-box domain-containing protein n=1 Tax=Exidia glandulosa HHB12029 TaxID=1314781 RepID=A0A165NXT1_EXIGL|nr:hypothetical protein EXIGLDRAFT_830096 [Exidia glandulosa HHB12029]
MIELPSELVIDIFDLACAEDAHDIEQKVHLAQVCAYWRAVALAYPTFWARIRIRTPRDGVPFRIALGRSGDTSLDVELPWQDRVEERILTDVEQCDVIEALIAPAQRLRLKRLYVEHSRAVHESLLHYSALAWTFLSSKIWSSRAPSLRKVALSTVDLELWETLITSSAVEHLYLYLATYMNKDVPLLTRILSRCPALRLLEWDYGYVAFASDHAVAAHSCPLAPRLHALRLGHNVDPYEVLRLINRHRTHMVPIHDITASMYYTGAESLELLRELFQGTGYLVDLRIDESDRQVVIRDNVGRIRRLIFRNDDSTSSIPGLWIGLATQCSRQDPGVTTNAYRGMELVCVRILQPTSYCARGGVYHY